MQNQCVLVASLLLAGMGATQAATIDFGAGPTSPSLCSAAPTGLGPVVACGDGSYISQSHGDLADVLDVSYSAPRAGTPTSLRWWANNYNNLFGVAWADTSDANSQARIDLRVLDGSVLQLNGFDLGAYPNTTRSTSLSITDLDSGATLYSFAGNVGTGSSSATSFNLSGISSSRGLRIQWQDSAYNVGIDNIRYSISAVPEPGSWALMAAGMLALGGLARRRHRA